MSGERDLLVSMRGITKTFGSVIANAQIDLDIHSGRVRGLLGENGAGKTTLMEVLYGLYSRDAGEIAVRGVSVEMKSPTEALAHGIGMVHQRSMLIPSFSVVENLMIGRAQRRVVLDSDSASVELVSLAKEYNLNVDPSRRVEDLTGGEAQRAEILRMLYSGASILILDEPTSRLAPTEVENLERIISTVTKRGGAVVFITHKLEEVMKICDDVTILRDGRKVADLPVEETDAKGMASLMVGRSVGQGVAVQGRAAGRKILEVKGLRSSDEGSSAGALKGVDLEVRQGEIVGIAGVDGNGQRELVEVILGLRDGEGTIKVQGAEVGRPSPRAMARLGVGCVPANRATEGVFPALSVAENVIAKNSRSEPVARFGMLSRKGVLDFAQEVVRRYDVKPADPLVKIAALSGGNQQKCAIARELERDGLRLLIVLQPTSGLDIGAAQYIHERLIEARNGGVAILLLSNELTEVLQLSDRVTVISQGRLGAWWERGSVDVDTLGLEMGGLGSGGIGTTASHGTVIGEDAVPGQRDRARGKDYGT